MPSRLAGRNRSVILSIGFIASLLDWRWALWWQKQFLGRMILHAPQSSAPLAFCVAVIGAPLSSEALAVSLADLAQAQRSSE
jgi:hypothetical protein